MKYSNDEIKYLKARIANIDNDNQDEKDNETIYFLLDFINNKVNEDSTDMEAYYKALEKFKAKSKQSDIMIKTEDGSISLIELKNMIKDEIKEELKQELKQELSGDENNESKHSFLNNYYNSKNKNNDVDNLKMLNLNNDFDKFKSSLFASAGTVQKTFDDYSAEFWKNTLEKWKSEVTDVLNDEDDYDFDNYVLVSNVKEIIEELGIKQTWLTIKTQIPTSTMRSILNNTNAVSLENAFKIAKVLKMPIEKLFTYKPSNEVQNKNG